MKIALINSDDFMRMIMVAGHSYRSFGRASGVSHHYIAQIAKGEKVPSPKIAKKIHVALDKDFEDIFFIDDGNKSDQKHSA